jgi:hypothetical protein
VFQALFCIIFGAGASAQAQSFGPELGKVKTAAAKVFGIIDTPTEIEPANYLANAQNWITTNFLEPQLDDGTNTSSEVIPDIEF